MKGYTWELPVEDSYPITVLGIGTTGLAVVGHLYQLGLRDVRFVVCHADDALLRTSPVPGKLLFDAEEDAASANQMLKEQLLPILTSTTLTIIVTDLSEPIDYQLVSIVLNSCADVDAFALVALGMPSPDEYQLPEEIKLMVASLQHQAHSLLVYERNHLPSAQWMYQLSDGIYKLVTFCDSFTPLDYADMRKIITRPGRIAVTLAVASGEERIEIVLNDIAAQLYKQPFDVRHARRVMHINASAREELLLVPEHMAIMKRIMSFMTHEPAIVLQGLIIDNRLYNSLQLATLFWMPA